MLPVLLLVLTSTQASPTATSTGADESGGGLFMTEEIPDRAPPSGGAPPFGDASSDSLFMDDVQLEPVNRGFSPTVRHVIQLDTSVAVDTNWVRPDQQVFEWWLGARLELDATLTDELSAFVDARVRYVVAWNKDSSTQSFVFLNPPEAHATWTPGPFRLSAGLKIFNWGSSDFVAPNDVLNPPDLRRLPLDPRALSETKVPVLAAEASVVLGPLTVRGVIEPFFTPTRFFLYGWDTALGRIFFERPENQELRDALPRATYDYIGDQAFLTERPEDKPENMTVGGRASLNFDDFDVSATAVYGWDPVPGFKLDEDLAFLGGKFLGSVFNREPVDILDPDVIGAVGRLQDKVEAGIPVAFGRYDRRSLIGFDFAWAVDPFIFKVDVAYTFDRTVYTQDFRVVRHPWLNSVVGVEFFHGDSLQIVVEAFAITLFDVKSYYRILLFEPNAPPPSMFDEKDRTIAMPGTVAAIRYSILGGDVRFELGGATTYNRGDFALLPNVRWAVDDYHAVSVGAVFIDGRSDGYGGIYGDNDQVYVGYTFSP